MVKEIRVPSSSSSSSKQPVRYQLDQESESQSRHAWRQVVVRTNGVGLDLDTILNVGASRVVGVLVSEDGLAAQRVDEGSSACKLGDRRDQRRQLLAEDGGRSEEGGQETGLTYQYQMLRRPSDRTGFPSSRSSCGGSSSIWRKSDWESVNGCRVEGKTSSANAMRSA